MPGTWTHLAARFFDVVTATPLNDADRARLRGWLTPAQQAMFLAQSSADQRHGLECGLEILATHPDRLDLVRAALLHDIGKRHARLGPLGRVFASTAIRLGRVPVGRPAIYADHGAIGSEELAELGAEGLVVDFARHHHHERPASIDPADWELLVSADRARIAPGSHSSRYAGVAPRNGRR